MKKYWHIALMLLCVLVVSSSCSKDDNEVIPVDEAWKIANEEAFLAQTLDPDYTKLKSESNEGFILYKVLKKGEGTEQIYFNSVIKAHYKGTFINGTIFDRTPEGGAPSKFAVNEVVDGWTTALQHMHVGDKWEIWIPQQLAYGPSGNNKGGSIILPYTTLIFDLEVAEIVQQ